MRMSAGLIASLAVAGCVQQQQPLSFAPGLPKATELKSQLVFYDYRGPAGAPGAFTIRFNDGSSERVVRPMDLKPREYGFPSSQIYRTRSTGTAHVTVDYAQNGHKARGTVDLPLKPDWIWSVSLHVTSGNPLEGCMGCMGLHSFPITGATGPNPPKLHLVLGGNSILHPAVY